MSKFVEKTNLPDDAKSVFIGKKYAPILCEPLKGLGIDALLLPDNPHIDPRLSGHADMSVLHIGKNRLYCAQYLDGNPFADVLRSLGFELYFSDIPQKAEYPGDAVINACGIGKRLVYSPKVTDRKLADFFLPELIAVRQGYCNCSICAISESSVITSDSGIAMTLRSYNFDVLEIRPGYIKLEGFPYGFIGGCSFMIGRSRLAFTGSIDRHPDKDRIMSFLSEKNIQPVFLTDDEAFDIGSAVPVLEK